MDLAKFKHDYIEATNKVIEEFGLTPAEKYEVKESKKRHELCFFASVECRMVELARKQETGDK